MRIRKIVGMLMGVEGIVVEDLRVDVSREVLVVVVRARRNVTDQRRLVALAGSMCLVSFSASGA